LPQDFFFLAQEFLQLKKVLVAKVRNFHDKKNIVTIARKNILASEINSVDRILDFDRSLDFACVCATF